MSSMRILLATQNQHKVAEILKIWGEILFEVLTLEAFPGLAAVVEDGTTFTENALKKAREVARQTKLITVSDDSGIEVDGLEGRPGVFSARYAGEGATDRENNEKLIQDLKGFSADSPNRKAHFRCVAALVDPKGFETTVEGVVEGRIIEVPRGKNGFGYDPLFLIPSEGRTTAELSFKEKNAISHRAKAFQKMKEILFCRYKTGQYPA